MWQRGREEEKDEVKDGGERTKNQIQRSRECSEAGARGSTRQADGSGKGQAQDMESETEEQKLGRKSGRKKLST